MELQDFWGLAGVPVVAAVMEAIKRTFPGLEQRWYWLVALGCSAAINVPVGWQLGQEPVITGLFVLVTSLAASGLYGQVKSAQGK